MSFAAVRDQVVALRLLRNLLLRERVPHGLLFWGPDGVGKRLAAHELAKALVCQQGNGDACDACSPCRKVASGNHADVMVVTPVKRSRIIAVETVESINEMASLRPFEGRWRLFLIEDADRMGLPAQNHFLKTLEEPPGNSVFILLTAQPRALLPTIRSRCQQIRFCALQPRTVADLLRGQRDVPPETAAAVAALSQGQMSRALSLVDTDRRGVMLDIARRLGEGADPLAVSEEFAQYLGACKAAIEAAVKGAVDPDMLQELSRDDRDLLKAEQSAQVEAAFRRDQVEFLYLFSTWYRDVLVYRSTGDRERVLNRDQLPMLESAPEGDYPKKLGAIEKARVYLERFLNEERVFRDLFFALAG